MKLKTLRLKNFRSYSIESEISISDLNVLIGRNDVGKSSILEALDIFFNGKPDMNDLSVTHDSPQIEITCVFDNLPDNLILDDTVSTSLSDEYLLNNSGDLEIKKTYPISRAGSISEKTKIICQYPDHDSLADILSKKNTTLKLMFEELGINSEGVDKRRSKELRNAIRNHHYPDGNITTIQKEIVVEAKLDNEDNRRKIWSSLNKYLPIYSLFFVDKPLTDQDSDIQDPMKEIVKEVLKRDSIAPLLEDLKTAIQLASTSLADDTIAKLNDLDSNLAETLRSNFPKEPSWNTIFKLSLEDERGVPLNKRGSGMRRLVLLSFFRAQVENRRSVSSPNIIYALEEPETSQHPDFQMMIVNALKELSETSDAQVLFTTHNSNLAKEISKDSLRYIYQDNDNLKVENGTHEDGTDNSDIIDRIIDTLGALPDPKNKVKVLVFVEGENDVNGLINFSKLLHEHDSANLSLENNESIAFIPTGGSQLKHYIEKKYLDGLTQAQVHIYDSDKPEYISSVQSLNDEGNPRKIGFNTQKTELENYLHHDSIIECYKNNGIDIEITEIRDNDDVPGIVAKTIHEAQSETTWDEIHSNPDMRKEKQKSKISRAKKTLNMGAVECMTFERLQERGGYDEIKLWLDTINSFIN